MCSTHLPCEEVMIWHTRKFHKWQYELWKSDSFLETRKKSQAAPEIVSTCWNHFLSLLLRKFPIDSDDHTFQGSIIIKEHTTGSFAKALKIEQPARYKVWTAISFSIEKVSFKFPARSFYNNFAQTWWCSLLRMPVGSLGNRFTFITLLTNCFFNNNWWHAYERCWSFIINGFRKVFHAVLIIIVGGISELHE